MPCLSVKCHVDLVITLFDLSTLFHFVYITITFKSFWQPVSVESWSNGGDFSNQCAWGNSLYIFGLNRKIQRLDLSPLELHSKTDRMFRVMYIFIMVWRERSAFVIKMMEMFRVYNIVSYQHNYAKCLHMYHFWKNLVYLYSQDFVAYMYSS